MIVKIDIDWIKKELEKEMKIIEELKKDHPLLPSYKSQKSRMDSNKAAILVVQGRIQAYTIILRHINRNPL